MEFPKLCKLIFADRECETRSLPFIPRVGEILEVYSRDYIVDDVIYKLNPNLNARTQIMEIRIYLG